MSGIPGVALLGQSIHVFRLKRLHEVLKAQIDLTSEPGFMLTDLALEFFLMYLF